VRGIFAWLFVVAMAVLGGTLGYQRAFRVPPDCASALLRDHVHTILVSQFHLPEDVRYALVRTEEGGFFASRFVCSAELVGDRSKDEAAGKPRRIVHYRSAYDPRNGELDISAGISDGPR
jgi:hypothetical protein